MSTQHKDITGEDAYHPIMYIQSGDPGAVGAAKWWLDTTTGSTLETGAILKKRNSGDSGWDIIMSGLSYLLKSIFTAKGDIVAATASGAPVKLALGTQGQVLTVDTSAGTGLIWANPSGGISSSIVTAKGDLISATASASPVRLGVGATGYVLTADPAEPTGLKWTSPGSVNTAGWFGKGPDVPPGTPDAADDEFDGASIDTAGTRISGATAWTAQNLGTSTSTQTQSCFLITPELAAGNNLRGYEQPLPGGNWKRRIKVAFVTNNTEFGAHVWVRNSANSNCESFGLHRLSTSHDIRLYTWDSPSSFTGTIVGVQVGSNYPELSVFIYLELEYDGTNMIYRASYNGVGYHTYATRTVATFLGAAPTHIGIGMEVSGSSGVAPTGVYEFFRKV